MIGLKKLRTERGMTLADVASKVGVIPNAVWRWEAGERTPSIETVKRLAALFDCTIDELVDSNPTTPPADPGPGGKETA